MKDANAIPSDTSGSNFLPGPLSDHCADDDEHDDDEHDDDEHDAHHHDEDDHHDIYTLFSFWDLSFTVKQAAFATFHHQSELYLIL